MSEISKTLAAQAVYTFYPLTFNQGVPGSSPGWVTTDEYPESPCSAAVFGFFLFSHTA